MTKDLDALCIIQETALAQLRQLTGQFWKVVEGEFHSQYNEMPMWVLLYEDSDINESHAALCDVLQPFMADMGPVNFTVGYYTTDAALKHFWDFLNDNREILAALQSNRLTARVDTELRDHMDIFRGVVSGKRP